jgi:hypothetical protein
MMMAHASRLRKRKTSNKNLTGTRKLRVLQEKRSNILDLADGTFPFGAEPEPEPAPELASLPEPDEAEAESELASTTVSTTAKARIQSLWHVSSAKLR